MGLRPKQLKYLPMLVVPVVAHSTIAAAPAAAATFSLSQGFVSLFDFSQDPTRAIATVEGAKEEFTRGGSVSVTAGGRALYDTRPGDIYPSTARNFSRSEGRGTGPNYWGEAITSSTISGIQFNVAANSTFKFLFNALTTNVVKVDDAKHEQAISDSRINFAVVDLDTRETIDEFTIVSRLDSGGKDTFNFETKGPHFWSILTPDVSVGGTTEYRHNSWAGSYFRYFNKNTRLALVEVKQSYAFVKAPEPGAIAGLLLLTATAARMRHARKRNVESLDA